ncbi:oxidoreductase-like protein [Colletotrichum truncatum]|uniref:Oxidoreductase-like protein n=1 Tax=Colletotrichum truncatum TaxID=5467 RepID=A0ACC3Z7M7_COLTU|nr:oxidoreductase-like protein [Colletotrichum truncatum]KAF6782508.1 oxidoreductase-like protein [Colletotrichum truncatum]
MSTQIEARSLASLNYLAANPPQYPHNPAEQRQEPLTLYISRVPGTRDVILTTSKPHIKNVTSEDVANSFYYIHLELPSDGNRPYELNTPQPHHLRNPDTPRSSQDSSRSANQIRRKPLPASAKVPSPPAEPVRSYPLPGSHPASGGYGSNYDQQQVHHGDAPDDCLPETRPELPPRPLSYSPPAPVRKPVGPRAIPTSGSAPAPDRDLPHPSDFHRPSPSGSPSRMPPQERSHRSSSRPPTSTSHHTRQLSRSPSPNRFHNTAAVPYTLSIIRRDPSTGNQWNIGRVSSHQLEDSGEEYEYFSFDSAGLSAHERRRANAPQPPINIRLESSGYAKFRHMPLRQSIDMPRTSTSTPPFANSEDALNWHQQQQQQQHPAEGGFTRQVVMAYTKSWTTNIREKFNNSRSRSESIDEAYGTSPGAGAGIGAPPTRSNRHSRQLSTHSTGSMSSNASDSGPIITQPGHGLRPRGYVFVSPWDGRCEFRTGNAGRSVKCRHVLPQAGGGLSNPLAPSGSSSSSGNSAPVSELRFNLPTTELFKQEGKREQLSGHFSKFLNIGNRPGGGGGEHSDGDDDVPSPFDLRLGREKAGGGNRGKRAKLGKLIIYPEGLKMLDLVVAANMGVWWGAWEKSF